MLTEKIADHPGIQIEIVTKVMARISHGVDWHTMTNNRAIHELTKGKLDGVLNISELVPEGFYSTKSIVEFSNCLIGKPLEDGGFKDFETFAKYLKDHPKLRLSGFQGASQVFKEYLPNVSKLSNYEEVPHQKSLAATLLMDRANYILSDFLVFRYYSQELRNTAKLKENPDQYVCLKQIPSAPRAITLKDKILQEKFDIEFEKMVKSGEREKIIAKYQLFLTNFFNNGHIPNIREIESMAYSYK